MVTNDFETRPAVRFRAPIASVLVLACFNVAPRAEAEEPSDDDYTPLAAVRVVGTGCHRDLISADGKKLCSGVFVPIGNNCAKTPVIGPGGAHTILLGRGCKPPGPSFADLGLRHYLVEDSEGKAFTVICDDAPV